MLSAICFNLDQSKILLSGNGLSVKSSWLRNLNMELFGKDLEKGIHKFA